MSQVSQAQEEVPARATDVPAAEAEVTAEIKEIPSEEAVEKKSECNEQVATGEQVQEEEKESGSVEPLQPKEDEEMQAVPEVADEVTAEAAEKESNSVEPPQQREDAEMKVAPDEVTAEAAEKESSSVEPVQQEEDAEMKAAPEVADEVTAEAAEKESKSVEPPQQEEDAEMKAVPDEGAAEATAEVTAEVSAEVPAAVTAELKPAEEMPTEQKTPEPKSRKRAAPSKTPPNLEAMASKIKRLREEADQAETAIAEEVKKLEELQAKIASMRGEADAKRAAAERASQEYVKKQCEAAIAQLEGCIPKRVGNPFVTFRADVMVSGTAAKDQNKQIADRWANLAPEEKQKYKDRYEEGMKKFNEWSSSEEGQKNLRERNELIKKIKATGIEELGKAIEAIGSTEPAAAAKVSPAKRPKEAEETPTKEMPAKQRRVAAARPAAPAKPAALTKTMESSLDEAILEEAGKADLVAQLRNLAARPDVLALGKSPQELLDTLKAHSGMVNAAKHALLSAGVA